MRPVGAELFHAEGRTDRRTDMKLIVAFHNFANAPTNWVIISHTAVGTSNPAQIAELHLKFSMLYV